MRTIVFTLVCCATLAMYAGTPQEEVTSNYYRSASNHYAYPIPAEQAAPELTAAPAGYEAFYMSHCGRHGSRWLVTDTEYNRPVRQLERADSAGVLTMQGKRLLSTLREVQASAELRVGDLSDVGAVQHQGIANRMADNFPTIFGGDALIDARSSTVLRCILSMQNETMTLQARNPRLNIKTDASMHDMNYIALGYGEDTLSLRLHHEMRHITDSIYTANVHSERFMRTIIADSTFATTQVDGPQLMRDVFNIAGSLQNHYQFDHLNLFYLFTNDEIFDLWRLRNIYWYVNWASNPFSDYRMPYSNRALLRNMVDAADAAVATGTTGASLRFSHEVCLMPLICLMELDNVNFSTTDLDNLHYYWQDYNIIPMACNVQMVLYRPISGSGDVLVKVLLNEHEATLPVDTQGPYARWDDLKAYYDKKIEQPIDWNY